MAGAASPAPVAEIDYLNPKWKTEPDARDWGVRGPAPYLSSLAQRLDVTQPIPMQLHDARPLLERGELSLDTTGFVLVRHVTQCKDFHDGNEMKRVLYPEWIDMIKRLTGAAHAVVVVSIVRTDVRAGGPGSRTTGRSTRGSRTSTRTTASTRTPRAAS